MGQLENRRICQLYVYICIRSGLVRSDQLFLHKELQDHASVCSNVPSFFFLKKIFFIYLFILQQRVGWEHPVPHIHDSDE